MCTIYNKHVHTLSQKQVEEENKGMKFYKSLALFSGKERGHEVTGKCPVPPKRDRRGQGAQ